MRAHRIHRPAERIRQLDQCQVGRAEIVSAPHHPGYRQSAFGAFVASLLGAAPESTHGSQDSLVDEDRFLLLLAWPDQLRELANRLRQSSELRLLELCVLGRG